MTHPFSSLAASDAERRLLQMAPGAEAPQGPQETPQAPEAISEQKMESTLKEPASYDEALAQAREKSSRTDRDVMKKLGDALKNKAENAAKELSETLDNALKNMPEIARKIGEKMAEKSGIRPAKTAEKKENGEGLELKGDVPMTEKNEKKGVEPKPVGNLKDIDPRRVEEWEGFVARNILGDNELSKEYGMLIALQRSGTLPEEYMYKVHVDTVHMLQKQGIPDQEIEGMRPKSEAEMHAFWQLLVDKGLQVPTLPEQGGDELVLGAGVAGDLGEKGKEGEKKEEPKSLDALVKGDGKWHAVAKEGGGEDGYEYSRQKDGRVYRKNAAGIAEVRSDNGKEWKSVAKEAGIDPVQNPETASIYNAVIASGKMDAWVPLKWDGKDGYQFMVSAVDRKLYSQETGNEHRIQKFDGGKWASAMG